MVCISYVTYSVSHCFGETSFIFKGSSSNCVCSAYLETDLNYNYNNLSKIGKILNTVKRLGNTTILLNTNLPKTSVLPAINILFVQSSRHTHATVMNNYLSNKAACIKTSDTPFQPKAPVLTGTSNITTSSVMDVNMPIHVHTIKYPCIC